jgi:hypothetical protein
VGDEPEARGVRPLHVVDEQRERMFGGRARREQPAEHQAEPRLRLGQGQLGHRRLGPDDEPELRDQIHDQLAVRTERLRDPLPPPRDPGLALRQDVERELPERLGDREVRDVALVLLELARDEPPAPPHDRAKQLAHHRRLADARVSRHQDQLRSTGLGGAVERLAERRTLGVAAVQHLRDPELLGDVPLAERERRDHGALAPRAQAALQVMAEPQRALVAMVGQLREQLADDVHQRTRQRRSYLIERPRLPRHMAMHPPDHVLRLER